MTLRLINCDETLLRHILEGDASLAAYLKVGIPQPWSEFGHEIFGFALEQIIANPSHAPWWTYLPVLEEENTLVGSCGYKGPPKDGAVEIGYEVAKDYRSRGLASQMASLLVEQAFQNANISTVLAHTLAEENASCQVLRKCGFKWVEELHDEEDGDIWKWQLLK